MNKEQLIKEIIKDVVKYDDQGYALYFRHKKDELKSCYIDYPGDGFNTNFRLASVSKQFIAMAIIDLVKEGKLTFDTIVRNIFNELPEYFDNITIRNLLNHTSGIYDYEDMEHTDLQVHDDDIITFLKTTDKTYFEVSSKYQYSNTAYVLLGLIIKKVSGKEIGDFIKENVFEKANMQDSIVNYEPYTQINNRAYGHIRENGKKVLKDQYWCSATIGDGGLYSNINDLRNWIKYLINNHQFLKDNMFSPNIIDGYNTEYGMGMRIIKHNDNVIYYHCGSTIGTHTIILFSIDLDLECIFLTNNDDCETSLIKDNILKIIDNYGWNK